MKDYYKILGVKENASEEEIRAHWIELTKHYHPDLKKSYKCDQKVKEINEAYQTLKFSSNRLEYDLKRNYERRKRRLYIKRISPYVSIFVFVIILCTLFIGKFQVPSLRKLESATYYLKDSPQTQSNPINEREKITRRSEIEQIERIAPQLKSEVAVKIEKVVPKSSSQTIFESETSVEVEKVVLKEITEVISQESLKIVPKEVSKVEEVKSNIEEPGSVPPSHFVQSENPVSSSSYVASTPLIAREEEIRQFFVNYTDRYTRKDIDGFLSFFSFKAIQNQKGFDEIKKVYTIFFKESEKLQYQLGELKIENHQNNVEVIANYKVDQVLKKRGEKKVWKGWIRWILVRENGVLKILSLDYQHQRST